MQMAEEAKQITLAGIVHRNADFNADEVHRERLRILHGEALANSDVVSQSELLQAAVALLDEAGPKR